MERTEPHAAQGALRAPTEASRAAEIFNLLVDAVEDYAIFALDPKGFILTWNLGGTRLKGYRSDEVIGTHFSRFYTEADLARKHPDFELQCAATKGKYEEEGWRVRKDGSRFWANVVIAALKDEATGFLRGFAKVTRDLTERKLADDALRAAYAGLEAKVLERTKELSAAKAKAESAVLARDLFFSLASHELKTPLTALKLQAQMRKRNVLKGRLDEFAPDRLVELCDYDQRQIDRLTFLVENMLDISTLTSGNFSLHQKPVDLAELVRDSVSRAAPLLRESGNDCTLDLPAALVGIWDRLRLEQVLSNLLANAGKYAPGAPVVVTLTSTDTHAEIVVQDGGPGISSADRERVFIPFERVHHDSETPGLGLGLYICKQIVEAHHGHIRIVSEPGQGARFEISLPLEGRSS